MWEIVLDHHAHIVTGINESTCTHTYTHTFKVHEQRVHLVGNSKRRNTHTLSLSLTHNYTHTHMQQKMLEQTVQDAAKSNGFLRRQTRTYNTHTRLEAI